MCICIIFTMAGAYDQDYELVNLVLDDIINIPRRYLRDQMNPFEYFNEEQFKKRYRFSKDVVGVYLLPKVILNLEKPTKRGLPISPQLQLLIALRFYATGCFQVNYSFYKQNSCFTLDEIHFSSYYVFAFTLISDCLW